MHPRNLPLKTLLIIGMGVAALLVAGAGFFVFNSFALGPDEMPASIGDGEREEIDETLEAFFFGVDQFSPQVAGESMLTPGELGIEEFARMVFEIAAVESAGLKFAYNSLGAVELDEAAGVVHATAATELGNVPVDLVRRDGQWHVAAVPDLRVPAEHLPYAYEWEVTNSYPQSGGVGMTVVGEVHNTGTTPWLVLGMPGLLAAPDGSLIRTEGSGFTTRPFVDPGQSYPFRIDFTLPNGVEGVEAEEAFRPIPNIRIAHPADRGVLATSLTVEPPEREPSTEAFDVVVMNGEDEARSARVIAYVESEDGVLLDIYTTNDAPVPGAGEQSFQLPGVIEAVSGSASRIRFETWGSRAT